MTRLVIVIPCSGEKLDYDPVARAIAGENPYVTAGELYVGAFHRYARQRAEAIADEVLVMSAWFGLIRLDHQVRPYDVAIDDSNSIVARPSLVVHQAARFGLYEARHDHGVVESREVHEGAGSGDPWARHPVRSLAGIGDQRGRIARATRAELLGEPVGQLELLA